MIQATNVTLHVKDMDASIRFYQSIGFSPGNRWGNYYAQLTAPGITIGLHPSGTEGPPGNSGNVSIGFTADDLEQVKNHLSQAGIAITERNEEGGQFLHFTDPDGTALYFIKPKW